MGLALLDHRLIGMELSSRRHSESWASVLAFLPRNGAVHGSIPMGSGSIVWRRMFLKGV